MSFFFSIATFHQLYNKCLLCFSLSATFPSAALLLFAICSFHWYFPIMPYWSVVHSVHLKFCWYRRNPRNCVIVPTKYIMYRLNLANNLEFCHIKWKNIARIHHSFCLCNGNSLSFTLPFSDVRRLCTLFNNVSREMFILTIPVEVGMRILSFQP